ncbi:MAG: sugar phosphate isomerase/epimerase [Clostridia bacterium]
MHFNIGVIVDSFRVPLREGIVKAKSIGASGIQLYAVEGEMSPGNLNAAGRREWLDIIRSHGLCVTALVGDPGDGGFAHADRNPARIEMSKRIIDLALDLDSCIVTTHIGVIPGDASHPRVPILQQACETLGEYAAANNAFFAIETGPEPSIVLRNFLDSLSTKNVCVNFDPANLVMVIGEDPVDAVRNLKDYIVHTHAKDGRMLRKTNPEELYMSHAGNWSEAFIETPLGEGDVHFPSYLKALQDTGYSGFLTIEREVGENPYEDIRKAVVFLKNMMKEEQHS